MYRQSPSRAQRSKGIKVKHVLQICFLLVICFWLLYQVKHSHDKKKEFDEVDVKISQRTQGSSEIVKLGRKDLNPRVEDTTTSARSEDEEAEENAGEDEEIKPEEENAEEKKSEEKGDEKEGVGDEEIEEHEEDKSDVEADHEEDVIEEDKENEEKDPEDNDGNQVENESAGEEHDDDEQAHEAREEHYKADDASSAVTHESEVVGAEKENRDMKESKDHAGTDIVGNEHAVDQTNEQTTSSTGEDQKLTAESDPSRTIENKDIRDVGTNSGDGSDDHLKLANNVTEASSVTESVLISNSTEKGSELSQTENVTTGVTSSDDGSGLQTVALGLASNSSVNSTEDKVDSNLTSSTKVEDSDMNISEVSKTGNSIQSILPEQLSKSSNETEDSLGSSTTENDKAAEGIKSEDGSNDGTDGGSNGNSGEGTKFEDSSNEGTDGESNDESAERTKSDDSSNDRADVESNDNSDEGTKLDDSSNDGTDGENDGESENIEEVQHDLIDTSDSSIGLQEKEVRTDLETLPEIQTEVSNDDDAAAE
ncbi:OLC1v1002831C1 [Oldenlandia corymbosa var. corymbosa]|uniref:OLC1v1002831C1 n=1 Tax=Oldenlandia corymbosa var. corymbosa TaxID=529605 RepID=A0AAV1DC07_OLDCO|nr:OLC1v1002831C1 [Oldenlandia corymbosa var. corymbosa]